MERFAASVPVNGIRSLNGSAVTRSDELFLGQGRGPGCTVFAVIYKMLFLSSCLSIWLRRSKQHWVTGSHSLRIRAARRNRQKGTGEVGKPLWKGKEASAIWDWRLAGDGSLEV